MKNLVYDNVRMCSFLVTDFCELVRSMLNVSATSSSMNMVNSLTDLSYNFFSFIKLDLVTLTPVQLKSFLVTLQDSLVFNSSTNFFTFFTNIFALI